MVTLSALNLKVINNFLFNFGLSLIPDIRAKDRNEHAAVDTNGKQYYKGEEEDHGDGIGAHGDNKALISSVVVADVEQSHEGAFESGELPGLATEEGVSENGEGDEDGAEGDEEFAYQGVGLFDEEGDVVVVLLLEEFQDEDPGGTAGDAIDDDQPLAVDGGVETGKKGVEQQHANEVLRNIVDPSFFVLRVLIKQTGQEDEANNKSGDVFISK
jgi:hypothetical protein